MEIRQKSGESLNGRNEQHHGRFLFPECTGKSGTGPEKSHCKCGRRSSETEGGKTVGRYGISVREILKRTVIVEAENAEEAVRKTEDAVEREEIILDVDDYDDREIEPSEYWKGGRIPDEEDVSCYWQLDGCNGGI